MKAINATVYTVVAAIAIIAKFAWSSDGIAGFSVGWGVAYTLYSIFAYRLTIKMQPSKSLIPVIVVSAIGVIVTLYFLAQHWGLNAFLFNAFFTTSFLIFSYTLYWAIKWYRQIRAREKFDQRW